MGVEGDFRSLTWKARTKIGRSLLRKGQADFTEDDFDWRRYHLEYASQIHRLDGDHSLRLEQPRDPSSSNPLESQAGLALHPNHRALYSVIVSLNPTSVLEAGCGGGDHLHNLRVLLPEAQIAGIDRSAGQLDFLRSRNPEMGGAVNQMDLTLPRPKWMPVFDLVFTQAVIMHIQTGNGHRVALANLFALSDQYVVLMENWSRHNFPGDIRVLLDRGILPWEQLHLYERPFPDLPSHPTVLIASASPLTQGEWQEVDL